VKLPASAAALVCVAALAVVAAPALSVSEWRPAPVDFELAAGGQKARSTTLRPGKRFNLVGMRWRGGAEPRIAIRTRRGDGRWSLWMPLDAHAEHGPDPGSGEPQATGVSTPAWVGEADQVQYRMTRRVPGLRLHFVNTRGTATAADRARTALRRVANAAVGSAAATLGTEAAAQ
jgi:hypothetical protein